MIEEIASQLTAAVDRTARELRALDTEQARAKPFPGKWSVQEIIGHLIDSATNNHQRFVRAQQVDTLTFPKYEQDFWVAAQGYGDTSWPELLELWRLYNHHLAHVMRRVPPEKLGVACTIGPGEPVTLAFLIEDYLAHLEHHLRQIEERRAAL